MALTGLLMKCTRCFNRLGSTYTSIRLMHQASIKLNAAATAVRQDTDKSPSQYKIHTGLVLERRAVIRNELNEIEQKYQQQLNEIELQKSKLSAHEVRHLKDLERAEKRLHEDYEENPSEINILTAVDVEDSWLEEVKKLKLADKITEADNSGQVDTTHRKLDKSLYLLVKQNFNAGRHVWVFPQVVWNPDYEGSLAQLAETVLEEMCVNGNIPSYNMMGSAPVGYFKKNYSSQWRENYRGVKVFLHKAVWTEKSPDVKLANTEEYLEHGWLTVDEIEERVDRDYWRCVNKILHEF